MKIVLTESQLNQLIQEGVVEEGFISSLLGIDSLKGVVSKIVLALLLGAITFTSLPKILNQVSQGNPAVENVDQGRLIDKIKDIFTNIKNKEAQVTDKMETDAKQQATDISQNAIIS